MFGLAPGQYFVSARSGGFGPERTDEVTGFAPTYYPGTTHASEAQPVSVGVGQEVTAEFQLVAARLARVLGTGVDSAGRPLASGTVSLTQRVEGASVPAFGGNTSRVDEDGWLTLSAVPPGTYTFTSSSTVENFIAMGGDDHLPSLLGKAVVACIGPITAETARKHGLTVAIIPDEYTIEALTAALVAHFQNL